MRRVGKPSDIEESRIVFHLSGFETRRLFFIDPDSPIDYLACANGIWRTDYAKGVAFRCADA